MFKLDIPPDPREAAKLEAKRRRAEERKNRIFNARQRTMGLDVEALEQQIAEKKQREEEEKERERAMDAEMLENAKLGLMMEKKHQEHLRTRRLEDEEFHRTQQAPETRREFDLNDPSTLRQSRPPTHDPDVTLGISSLQVFDGEDDACTDRMQTQRQQQREWIAQQLHERLAKEAAEAEEEAVFREEETWQARFSDEVQRRQDNARRQAAREAAEYNKRMMEEKQRKKKEDKRHEWQRDYEEIMQTVQGGLVAEKRDDAVSHGPRKVVPDRYRGMTEDEIAQYREEQIRQAQEEEEKRAQIKEEERILQEAAVAMSREALLRERQLERQRKEQLRRQMEENAILAEEQKEHRPPV
ncbi:hypothetical protein PTSG_07543 [Salpingoeca rosetta]|uniref:Uncharacterized protein n=1 Tax=Salpingoeca rosetta (strain ATCC 50818 / BSB-021) TaxID=946362 RepID=F2UH27_SALR5|nr:uncharacterized protein PTSG_07543 [Salpingoeca rosetta]EGD76426.1 hypothetical protein PTSG_07543 [Salpingoeca rosetta]|eukprot:XP_004991341.1 hypothetical protein PTSG_07543 [Salpingoeca rosetta]